LKLDCLNLGVIVSQVHIASSSNSCIEQIASQLRSDIRMGLLAPGEALREVQLATRFGVSRSPIRQVLHQLTFEGFLIAKSNCGTVVADRPSVEVTKVMRDCRARLEAIALEHCFDDFEESDFADMRAILEDLYQACQRSDHAAAYHHDFRFHRLIIDKDRESGYIGIYSALIGATKESLNTGESQRSHFDFLELYASHAALYAIYRLGDRKIAVEALVQHILRERFVKDSWEAWEAAGKPQELHGVYDHLAPRLRRDANRRKRESAK